MIYLVYYHFGPVGLLDVYYRAWHGGSDGYFDIPVYNFGLPQRMIGDVRILMNTYARVD